MQFKHAGRALRSHCGYDIGALPAARYIAKQLNVSLIQGRYSRLLIDLNRSLHHPRLFSHYVKHIDSRVKQRIVDQYYTPYRREVESVISDLIRRKQRVLHLSIHSFTNTLQGKTRNADFGLLYDPRRKYEKIASYRLKQRLNTRLAQYHTRCNYPYKGTADGFTTYLRKQFRAECYVGIEFEINQALLNKHEQLPGFILSELAQAIQSLIECA